MSESANDVFSKLALRCVNGLFEAYGLAPIAFSEAQGCAHEGVTYVGTIGFAAPGVRGSVCLQMGQQLVASSHPVHDTTAETALLDWVRELVNQLVGRVKNRMLDYGIRLAVGAPVAVVASGTISVGPHSGSPGIQWYRGETAGGFFFVMLDAQFTGGLELVDLQLNRVQLGSDPRAPA